MEASLNDNPLDWKDNENFVIILTLTFRYSIQADDCKRLGLLVLVFDWGFGGGAGRQGETSYSTPTCLCKIKIKTENLQGKVNIPREKICSQSVFEKKAVMTDRGAKTYSSSLGKSCDKGPSVFLKVWQYVHSVFLSHSMQTMQFFLTC